MTQKGQPGMGRREDGGADIVMPIVHMEHVRPDHAQRVQALVEHVETLANEADAGIRIQAALDQLLTSSLTRTGERVSINVGADEWASLMSLVSQA